MFKDVICEHEVVLRFAARSKPAVTFEVLSFCLALFATADPENKTIIQMQAQLKLPF